MKLGQVRKILEAYEQTKGWWARFWGDSAEVLRLKAHLLQYEDQADEYELTGLGLLEVVRCSLLPGFSLVKENLKDAINYSNLPKNRFFITEISDILQEKGLLTEANFSQYANCKATKSHSIWATLLTFKDQSEVPLTQEIFEFIPVLAAIHLDGNRAFDFIKNLYKHRLVNKAVLAFLKMKGNDIYGTTLLDSILALNSLGLFDEEKNNEDGLAFLEDEKYKHYYFDVLVLLSKIKVGHVAKIDEAYTSMPADPALLSTQLVPAAQSLLNKSVFQAWLSASPLVISQMEKILPYFLQDNCVEREDVLALFAKKWTYFFQFETVLKILAENKVLSHHAVKWLLAASNLFVAENVVTVLAKADLLSKPVIHLSFPDSSYEFLQLIRYLGEANVLNEETLNTLLILVSFNKEKKVSLLFDEFSKENFYINEKNAILILKKANDGLSEVREIFSRLLKDANTIANNENLTRLLTMSARNLHIVSDMIESLASNKLLDQSSFDRALAQASIKIPSVNMADNKEDGKNTPHQAKYYQLLGRASHFFNQQDREEIKLDQVSVEHMQAKPYADRLQWIISGLSDLAILHDNHRIQGNVSPMSFAINVNDNSLSLIDFKQARKRYSQAAAANYVHDIELAVHFYREDFCDDMYGYAFVIAKIFPEIYEIEEAGNLKVKADVLETPENYAMITLVDTMLEVERSKRCSSREALRYCQQLASEKEFDASRVNAIASDTIRNPIPTLEDTLHGVSRLSM